MDNNIKNFNIDQLFQKIRNGKLEFFKKNKKYNNNIINEYGQSFLHEAVINEQIDIAYELLNQSIDVNIQDKKGQTVLHIISFYPNNILAEKILKKGGNINLKDLYGNTPLWYAVFNARGNYELVKLFMKYKPDVNLKNNAGRTPLDFAIQIKDELLISYLNY